MENATKALLIAAAIIILLAVLSLFVVFWDDVAIYFTANHEEKMLQQLIEFNNKFANYDGKEIRGNELVSIMNRIVDYNNFQSDMEGYEPIKISIKLEKKEQFLYGTESLSGSQSILPQGSSQEINNIMMNPNIVKDQILIKVATTSERLVKEYGDSNKIPNLTDTKLQKMSAGIDTIVVDDDEKFAGYDIETKNELIDNRDKFLTKVLGYDVSTLPNKDTFINYVETATYQYYQFTMFKRAIFRCTEVNYNQTNGRINKMIFKATLDDNGNIIFD